MGLDVNLYKYENLAEYERRSKVWEEIERATKEKAVKAVGYAGDYEQFANDKKVWGKEDFSAGIFGERKYEIEPNKILQDQYFKIAKELLAVEAEKFGVEVDSYGYLESAGKGAEHIRVSDQNHPKYPDHYFKIGYFRSSYNSSGIEQVFRTMLGKECLYHIFDVQRGDYRITPDWNLAKERCQELKKEYAEAVTRDGGVYVVNVGSSSVTPMWDPPAGLPYRPKNEAEAMNIFRHEKEKSQKGLKDYSGWYGSFWFSKPIQVIAVIPGTGFLKESTSYLICQNPDFKSPTDDWYYQALEIVEQTIDYVLGQPDKEKYVLHWSA